MASESNNIHIYVIHVRGQKKRKLFMEQQLKSLGFPYEYIQNGNIEDLTQDILSKYFIDNGQTDTMFGPYPRTSCAYKSFLAYKQLIDSGKEGALVIEDDIRFFPFFKSQFLASVEEIKLHHKGEPLIANYEESSLMLVSRSKRRKGQYLYRSKRDRFAGCCYVSKEAAHTIIDYVKKEKCDMPLDRFHTKLVKKGLINYYWSYPCLAVQRSCDGSMPTMIPTRPRPLKRLKWFYKRFYKHLLYWFR